MAKICIFSERLVLVIIIAVLLYATPANALTDLAGPFRDCWLETRHPQWWLLPAAVICAGAGTFSIAKKR